MRPHLSLRRTSAGLAGLLSIIVLLTASQVTGQASYQLFEGGPVRPLGLSTDGARLFAVNTPDGHLEVLDVAMDGTLSRATSVQVGLEPVAVAVKSATEVWVVNHLSDSVSIIDLSGTPRGLPGSACCNRA